jgi:hypothetical protein
MASKVAGRTVREFTSGADVWFTLDRWAGQTGYEPVGHDQFSRLYQKGSGFWMAPRMLQMTYTGNAYRLEAWVRLPLLNRIITLGLMPAEMNIDAGGFVGSLPRKQAKEHVNLLLQALGLPLME